MLTAALVVGLCISLYMWFMNNMAFKGALYYFAQRYGSEVLDEIDMKNIINVAIEKTINDIFNR